MSERNRRELEEKLILESVARLRAGIVALVFGLTGGVLLCVATVWLVIRGGEVVGPHLGLLRYYFPGYTVSWGGAAIGFLYGALVGGLIGGSVAWIYNKLALRRWHRRGG